MAGTVHAFFDFDGTLIEGDSILFWLRFYYRHRPGRRIFQIAGAAAVLLYVLRLLNSHALKRVLLWPMSFERPERLEALAAAFVRDDLVFRFRQSVLERLWAHHFLGHKVTVISASGTFYLKHIQSVLPPCTVLGTEMEWGRGFLRLPAYRDGNLRGENKIRRLKDLGLGEAGRLGFAYSDHHQDMPLLRFVDFPVCVRPTPRLRRRARSFVWPVWDWPGLPVWRRRLNAICMLLFAWAPGADPDRSGGAKFPGKPLQDEKPPFVRIHVRALREMLKDSDPAILEAVFTGHPAPPAPPTPSG